MRTGLLSPKYLARLVAQGVAVSTVLPSDDDLDLVLRLAWLGRVRPGLWNLRQAISGSEREAPAFIKDDFLQRTPFALSALGVRSMTRIHPESDDQPVILVVGDHADDFAFALALDRCGVPVLWLPFEFVGSADAIAGRVLETLTACLADALRPQYGNTQVAIHSLSLEVGDLQRTERRLKQTVWGMNLDLAITPTVSLPPFRLRSWLDPACFDEQLEEPFIEDRMARSVPVAVPSEVTSDDPWKLMWWSEVNDPQNALPGRSALNPLVVADHSHWFVPARCGQDGVSFFSHGMGLSYGSSPLEQLASRPRLRFPGPAETFKALFAAAGYTTQESPAGRFRRLATGLFGGLDSLSSDLGDPQRLALLRAWLSQADSGVTPGVLPSGGRRVLSLTDAVEASGFDEASVRDLLDDYLAHGIVRRGFVLKCHNCLRMDWYSLGELDQAFTCHRCEAATRLTAGAWRSGSEPAHYYDLAEVVFQALRENFDVPIAALARIKTASRSFQETPEMELVDEQGRKMELDLFLITDGRIGIGEAKTAPLLKNTRGEELEWLRRFRKVAEDITADYVVLATAADSWRRITKERAETVFSGASVEVQFLDHC